jgi:MFS transporter, ACS family, tartrate transporter
VRHRGERISPIATINWIGNLGGLVGPAMIGWIKDQTGSFTGGLYFVGTLLVLSAVLTLVLARSLQRPAPDAIPAHSRTTVISRTETTHEDL